MKKKQKVKKDKTKYTEEMWYKITQDIIIIIGLIVAIIGLYYTILVRQDTLELTKMSEKDIYYKIRLYPTNETTQIQENGKYIRMKLNLVVDDFEILNEELKNVNYNASFTHVKYFIVYDYIKENNQFFYKIDKLDDKTEAQMRLEDKYYISITETNYSLTPNNKYAYILIETETTNTKNLDLVFFRYRNNGDYIDLDIKENENGNVEVDHNIIDKDVEICEEYYTSIWAEDEQKKEDIDFMFKVYNDLWNKIENY